MQEAAQWIEYVTAPNGPMAAERAANGRNIELAEILTAPDPHARNTFERPDAVKTMLFKNAKVKGGKLIMELPGVSVASVRVK